MNQNDMVMVANPYQYIKDSPNTQNTIVVDAECFFSHPVVTRAFHQCWTDNFRSPHKHYCHVRHAWFVVVAVRGSYLQDNIITTHEKLNCYQDSDCMGFALVTHDTNRKLQGYTAPYSIEEVMTREGCKKQGVATAVMHRLMRELQKKNATKIFLTYNEIMQSSGLHLPTFYGKFGFREVLPTPAN